MLKRSLLNLTGRLALTGVMALLIPAAHALTCGTTITANTTLTQDLGPCPSTGLTIGAGNITLNLNGHKISGTGVGAGISLPGPENLAILGPGEIASFATGIEGTGIQRDILINSVDLESNVVGMSFENSAYLRISGCNIDGGAKGQTGLNLGELAFSYVYFNTIERHSVTGVMVTGAFVISQNIITLNGSGLQVYRPASATISGNTISFNKTDGVNDADTVGGTSTIEGNTITFNGGNGVVESGPNSVVQNNIVLSNGANGIKVVAGPNNIQVEGNILKGNGTDLFWGGTGTNICWDQNLFQTSSPSALPVCPH
jgi:parallel beta-helix repeat protein